MMLNKMYTKKYIEWDTYVFLLYKSYPSSQ